MFIGAVLRQRYKIIQVLGRGGFGDTYLAEDLDLPKHHQCVVKHLKLKNSDNETVLAAARRLFQTEAETLYNLGYHGQIPKLFAHFEEDGEFYLVQEFINGQDLTKEIYPGNKLPEHQVKQLLIEILEVLAFVHHHNIVHRDIKPQNIMRRYRDGKITLIDFGAVKEIMATTTQIDSNATTSLNTSTITSTSILTISIGSPGFMPSEQALGRPKLSSDIYAVGMLGIYALTGKPPQELPKDPINEQVIWRECANVSKEFADILNKMVSYHFKERYPSAKEALNALIPPPEIKAHSRRSFLQTVSLVGVGFGLAFVVKDLIPGQKNQETGNYKINHIISNSSSAKNVIPVTKNADHPIFKNLQNLNFSVVKTNIKGKIIERNEASAKYLEEDLGNGIKLEIVQIPEGLFIMGSPEDEKDRFSDEGPQHQVTVSSFFMGKYPVTQAQYKLIMNSNPSFFSGDNRPVERVTWKEAVKFCQLLSEKTGRKYRLPSEAEWEYACRAGTKTPFYFGESVTPDLVNYNGNYPYGAAPKGEYRKQTTKVGQFPPNSFGLYDMSGNVWEWCQDCYQDNYRNLPKDGSAMLTETDPKFRLMRGGSCYNYAWYCRSATRLRGADDIRTDGIGFRVVLEIV